ncbi:14238_t:CDS:2, partial [Ambispora leptoticha]
DTERRSHKKEHISDTQIMNDKHLKDLDPEIDCISKTAESLPNILSNENMPKRSCGIYSDKKVLMIGKFMNNDVESHVDMASDLGCYSKNRIGAENNEQRPVN